jgi:hypothetical protein
MFFCPRSYFETNTPTDVAGAAALLLQADPSTTGTQAANNLIDMAVKDRLSLDIAVLSPNRLLYTGKIGNNAGNR